MAVLRAADHDELVLPDRCLVGRSRSCDLVLTGRDVSGEHAVLQWSGAHWELRDLGSRNGTFVGEQRLASGARVQLQAGAELRFGRESPPWLLVDASGPQLLAIAVAGGERRIADGGYLALPHPDAPAVAVYQDTAGVWLAERDGTTAPIEDRALLDLGPAGLWRVHLPAACGGTWEDGAAPLLVAQLRLRFAVSRDEEYVELVAFAGDRRIDLQARAHHYPLLMLARRRVADQQAGVAARDQGYVRQDELLAMLKMGDDHLSISIHRARTQLGRAGIADAAGLVERRPGTRQLRIGVAAIELATLP